MKSVLIISYVFPPYPGIGGRRWAKFAKYLANNGYEVHVICARNPFNECSNWTKDVINNSKIFINYLDPAYPTIILQQPKSIQDKVRYKFSERYLKLFSKGNIYDRSLFWKSDLINKASKIIQQNNIKAVITTGAPFHLLYFSTFLKKKHKDLTLISDFRDPWTDNKNFYGYNDLSPRRKKFEIMLENEVLAKSDYITTVADAMTEQLKQRALLLNGAEVLTLNNGYDQDEYPYVASSKQIKIPEKIEFIFTGNLYSDLEYIFYPFVDAIKKIKETKNDLYNRIFFNFYGVAPNVYKSYVKQKEIAHIQFFDAVSLSQAHLKSTEANCSMLFLNKDFAFSTSTKFFEYLALRHPILVFSKAGELGHFVEENKIGRHFDDKLLEEKLVEFCESYLQGNIQFNPEFKVEDYSVAKSCKKLIRLIEHKTVEHVC